MAKASALAPAPSPSRPAYEISSAEARAITLRSQGFGDQSLRGPIDVLNRLGVIQLDSVNVVARSHELIPFARLGPCSLRAMGEAIYRERRGFEYWGHEASWLPMEEYRHFRWRMEWMRQDHRRRVKELRAEHERLYHEIVSRIRAAGPLSSSAFEDTRPHRGTWWDRKPAKRVLEDLFARGELAAAGRTAGFARIYDLPERVLPPEIDTSDPGAAAAHRHLLRRAIAALGVATAQDSADYFRLKPAGWRPALAALLDREEIIPVRVEGWRQIAYTTPTALKGRLTLPEHRPTFLSPFDNMIWSRARTERIFGFHYRLEIYTPALMRKYGYYVLPLLARGRLVGRADCKHERSSKLLRCRALYFEGAEPGDAARALHDLSVHLHAESVTIEYVEPPEYAASIGQLIRLLH